MRIATLFADALCQKMSKPLLLWQEGLIVNVKLLFLDTNVSLQKYNKISEKGETFCSNSGHNYRIPWQNPNSSNYVLSISLEK